MKKIFTFFMAVMLIVNTTVVSSADPIAVAPSSAEAEFETIINSFLNNYPTTDLVKNTLEIVSVIELNGIRESGITAYAVDVVDSASQNAYFIVDAETGEIIEFSEQRSPYISYSNSANILTSTTLTYYYEPLEYWVVSDTSAVDIVGNASMSTSAFINAMNSPVTSISAFAETHVYSEDDTNYSADAIAKINAKSVYLDNLILEGYTPDGYIYGVPSHLQTTTYLCINTSILNIVDFWDATFPNLITGTLNQARADIESVLDEYGGSGYQSSIAPAIEQYGVDHGRYYTLTTPVTNPSYFDLTFEIDYGDPCMVGFQATTGLYSGRPHMTTGVGYVTSDGSQYVIVHDNHVTADVCINFSCVDYVCGVQFSG